MNSRGVLHNVEYLVNTQLGFLYPKKPSIKWGLEYMRVTRHVMREGVRGQITEKLNLKIKTVSDIDVRTYWKYTYGNLYYGPLPCQFVGI